MNYKVPKNVKPLSRLATILAVKQEIVAKTYYKTELDRVVEPFDHRIVFRVSSSEGKNFITNISPADEPAGINAAGDIISGRDLFRWLDEGTDIRWVAMPPDFENETFPNSLVTNHSNYDRREIHFLSEPAAGIDARNFLSQVGTLYENVYRNTIKSAIDNYIP